MEHPLLDLGRGFAVGPHASALGAQQESTDAQDVTEARELACLLSKDDRRGGVQQESWPRASSMRQIQPSASSLN